MRRRVVSLLVPLSLALLTGGALVSAAEPSSDPTEASLAAGSAASPPPGMVLVWADEFDAPAGAPPDPSRWTYDLGDGGRGWGNEELEWYTDRPENVAHDGAGNLVITAREAEPGLTCWYGPCRYTSARLLTQGLFELTYGRIEARLKVPEGAGLWPAFWMLGSDIGAVGWPASGEIDVMENVGRQPRLLYGTLHGPGYSGSQGFGSTLLMDEPLADDFHVYAVDWEPGRITWTRGRRRRITRRRPPTWRRTHGSSTTPSSCCSTSPWAASSGGPCRRSPSSRRRTSWTTCGCIRSPRPAEPRSRLAPAHPSEAQPVDHGAREQQRRRRPASRGGTRRSRPGRPPRPSPGSRARWRWVERLERRPDRRRRGVQARHERPQRGVEHRRDGDEQHRQQQRLADA